MTGKRHQYILKDKVAVLVSFKEWAFWYETADRNVAKTQTPNGDVSTVFLGIDHQFGAGPPLLFETMIFGGTCSGETWRCSTWAEAEDQHVEAIEFCAIYEVET